MKRTASICLFLLLFPCTGKAAALIPAGTAVEARLQSAVSSSSSEIGDAVVAVITRPVQAEGQPGIPEGSRLIGRVETVAPATSTAEGRMRLAFREIEFPDGRRAQAWVTEAFSAAPRSRNLRYALYIAAGAIVGGFIGGKSARAAGVIGGTLAGFVIAGETGGGALPDVTLKSGRTLHLQLGQDFTLE